MKLTDEQQQKLDVLRVKLQQFYDQGHLLRCWVHHFDRDRETLRNEKDVNYVIHMYTSIIDEGQKRAGAVKESK